MDRNRMSVLISPCLQSALHRAMTSRVPFGGRHACVNPYGS